MKERLQKIISARGLASRRKAEELITQGRVTVNGQTALLGDTADVYEDVIEIDGTAIPPEPEKVYIILNKPRGYVTTVSDEKGRRTALELVADCGARVYPVGRLDMDSEGLLLFTNDGELANRLMHPSFNRNKTYRVTVDGCCTGAIEALKKPIVIDGSMTAGAEVKAISENQMLITIHEGKNRQIRKMCASVGLEVKRLVRIAEDGIALGKLRPGKWRYLTESEISAIKNK